MHNVLMRLGITAFSDPRAALPQIRAQEFHVIESPEKKGHCEINPLYGYPIFRPIETLKIFLDKEDLLF